MNILEELEQDGISIELPIYEKCVKGMAKKYIKNGWSVNDALYISVVSYIADQNETNYLKQKIQKIHNELLEEFGE